MTNKSRQTKQRTNNPRDELIGGQTLSGNKRWCIIAPTERYSSYRYSKSKKKVMQSLMP